MTSDEDQTKPRSNVGAAPVFGSPAVGTVKAGMRMKRRDDDDIPLQDDGNLPEVAAKDVHPIDDKQPVADTSVPEDAQATHPFISAVAVQATSVPSTKPIASVTSITAHTAVQQAAPTTTSTPAATPAAPAAPAETAAPAAPAAPQSAEPQLVLPSNITPEVFAQAVHLIRAASVHELFGDLVDLLPTIDAQLLAVIVQIARAKRTLHDHEEALTGVEREIGGAKARIHDILHARLRQLNDTDIDETLKRIGVAENTLENMRLHLEDVDRRIDTVRNEITNKEEQLAELETRTVRLDDDIDHARASAMREGARKEREMSRLRRSLPYLLAALLGIIVVLLLVDKFGNFGKKAVETVAATPGAQTEISVTGPAAAPPIVKITTPTVAPAEKWYAMPIPAGLWKADVAGDQALVIPRGDNQPALTVVCHPEVTGTSPEGLFERKCKIVN